jgi:hypothetical protein
VVQVPLACLVAMILGYAFFMRAKTALPDVI